MAWGWDSTSAYIPAPNMKKIREKMQLNSNTESISDTLCPHFILSVFYFFIILLSSCLMLQQLSGSLLHSAIISYFTRVCLKFNVMFLSSEFEYPLQIWASWPKPARSAWKDIKRGLATFVFSASYVTWVARNHAEICVSERRWCGGCLAGSDQE